ncbi:hypothetical protein [Trinickia mobilis]|uniref:hypothetical protein n=1 Tax=Trinickia mobilis TaxID=2816356 RepID=UPI001A8C0E04|nr:hypothetical protein [Trinickia mobilis]
MVEQLGKLLTWVAHMGVAVRLRSAYNHESLYDPDAPLDVMWLSDSLHHMDGLGEAVANDDAKRVAEECDHLISIFEGYRQPTTGFKGNSAESFARASKIVRLDDGIAVLYELRSACLKRVGHSMTLGGVGAGKSVLVLNSGSASRPS